MSEYKTDSFLPCDEIPAQMSKRFYAACCAMQGILSTEYSKDIHNDKIIKMSYLLSDELLKQE